MKKLLKLWLIQRQDYIDYDEYDAFVIAANTEDEAREIAKEKAYGDWDNAFIGCIGKADRSYKKPQIVLASFHAG